MKEPDSQEGNMRLGLAGLALLCAAATAAQAEDMKAPINTSDIKWTAAPKALPPGARWFVLSGDPTKEGPYVVRLQLPAHYQIPAHNHPTAEMVTVLSGRVLFGMGDKLDEKKGTVVKDGGFAEAPAKMNHYVSAIYASVVEVYGQGPLTITYVDPADDPRNAPPR
jgi:quercetin dioxygenase-like cupin family protein